MNGQDDQERTELFAQQRSEFDGCREEPSSNDPSRRQFLKIAAAGSALAAGGEVHAEEAAGERTKTPKTTVGFTVNGKPHRLELDVRVTLLDALRERLDLTGSKKGCDQGQCGACTVLVDGRRVLSCLTFAVMVDGCSVTTVEGLAKGEELHPLQTAFIKHDGFQCGYCTPGQLCSAVGLLREGHAHTDADIRELMSGNLCRCGAYPNIVDAIREVRDAGVKAL